ncbi:hypothetical protein C8A03DRAFT_29035 [Achaetomium macrosporum]|uniref:F-box domain-containing protein n=1 Tax=Achaetomium macrosporum TaxID=79813 RepID=A0AAN7CK80_9PEZI|nr:hypothetical protein C8A03DRAFT_29035 [Achaetomium macrosporum]
MTLRLIDLPDDILFLVLAELESARDIRALALSCRSFQHLASSDGWRIFIRNRLPSLSAPPLSAKCQTWRQVAESMTWQSRCWDKRSLQFQALIPREEPRRNRRLGEGSKGSYMSVVDGHFDPATQEELVVWSAGEDIVARFRERRGHGKLSKTSWHRLSGKELGFASGYDDIKAIKIVQRGSGQAIITSRHNGQLSLLSAERDRFGECTAKFTPGFDSSRESRKPLEQETANSLDVLDDGHKGLLAAAERSCLRIYELPEGDITEMTPLTTYNMGDAAFTSNSARLGGARWMEQGESIALALSGTEDPLRYLALTPSGWTLHAAAKSERIAKEFDIKYERTICPNSLEPVQRHAGAKGATSLLLSAWKDGTIRLQDLRTPSPFDAVYQDNVDPWSNTESLMSYGTERFVAGAAEGLAIHVFDFRWTKGYYHTSGLPCLGRIPIPRPPQPFLEHPSTRSAARARCDHVKGLPCYFHSLSKTLYYRPNAKYFLSDPRRYAPKGGGVWSLARGSDISPNFYMGISGGVIEAVLEQTPSTYPPDSSTAVVDPNFGFDDWRAKAPPESGFASKPLNPAMMETGDGYSFKGNDRSIRLPSLRWYQGPQEWLSNSLTGHHRFDLGYHQVDDFGQELQ